MRTIVAAALVACTAGPVLAQDSPDLAAAGQPRPFRLDARLEAAADAALLSAEVAAPPALDAAAARAQGSGRRVLTGALGAVLGGWAGFMLSQVSRSDWDKEENGQFSAHRLGFTVGGAAAGAVTGVVLGRAGGGGAGSGTPRLVRPNTQGVITAEEIERSGARNALELVQTLRPAWLRPRGITSHREAGRGESVGRSSVSITPGESPIKVYLNNARLGDVSALRGVDMGSFSEVRYYDPAQATYRWGPGHFGGAIELVTSAD